jgi:hypothetical protein
VLGAHEVFITNSIMQIMPVCRLERTAVGNDKPGSITLDLSARLEKLIGEKLAPLVELYRELMISVGTTRQAGDCVGILAENLSEERSKRLVTALQAAGVESEIRDMAQLVPNPQAHQIRTAACAAEGFKVQDLYGRERMHPWETIPLMCVGRVNLEETELGETSKPLSAGQLLARVGVMAAGRGMTPPSFLKKQITEKKIIIKENSHLLLDIYTRDNANHYRVLADKFNYSYLGSRLASSTTENFRRLLADLKSLATQAVRNQWFDPFISSQNLNRVAAYSGVREFDEENRWWLQGAKY